MHINSGVQNYWFYLLTEGSANAPEGTVNNITVSGICADKARNIAFYNVDNFLGQNSQYIDARNGSIFSTFNLFGVCSDERIQTERAWSAVGIGDLINAINHLGLSGPSTIYINNGNIVGGMPKTWTATGGVGKGYVWSTNPNWTWQTFNTNFGWNNNIFSVSNFNNQYVGSISVSDQCKTITKPITFVDVYYPPYDDSRVISVSPNPASSSINVVVDYQNANEGDVINVFIHNSEGTVYFQQQYADTSFTINVNSLISGTYYLTAIQSGIQSSVTFIKN